MMDSIQDCLATRGWAHVERASVEIFNEIARGLGKVFYVTDIRLEAGSQQYAFRPGRFPIHMDAADARYVAWYVIDSDNSCCPMLVADSRDLVNGLPRDELEVLENVSTTYQEIKTGTLAPVPLVSRDEEGRYVASYFPTNLRMVKPRSDVEAKHIAEFERRLLELPTTAIPLRDSDIVILDNQRMLHGRGNMPQDSRRHLLRYWIHCGTKYEPVGLERR